MLLLTQELAKTQHDPIKPRCHQVMQRVPHYIAFERDSLANRSHGEKVADLLLLSIVDHSLETFPRVSTTQKYSTPSVHTALDERCVFCVPGGFDIGIRSPYCIALKFFRAPAVKARWHNVFAPIGERVHSFSKAHLYCEPR